MRKIIPIAYGDLIRNVFDEGVERIALVIFYVVVWEMARNLEKSSKINTLAPREF